MKFECGTPEIVDAFGTAAGIVAAKGSRPGPQEVLLEVLPENRLRVSATDLEVSLRLEKRMDEKSLQVETPGSVAVPAARTLNILREIPGEKVGIESDGNAVTVSAGKSLFNVVARPVEEFPPLPKPAEKQKVSLPSDLFRRMVRNTAFAAATERVHYSLNGVYLTVVKGEVKMVGTDGRRLAIFGRKVKGLKDASLKGIVPNKGIRLFEKLASGVEGDVTLALEKNQLFFLAEGMEASTLLIEGAYPDYERVIPRGNDQIMDVSTADLLRGLRQASILAGEEAKAVKFRIEKDKLTLLAESAGAGQAKVELPAVYGGEPIELQFNPLFFMDFLRQVEQERVELKFKDGDTAVLVQVGPEYTYVVMPLVRH